MTGLVRRNSAAAVPSGATYGGGVSTGGLAFDGTGPRWEDMPAHVRAAVRLGGPESAAEVDEGPANRVRQRDGVYWQQWTAWIARRDGIAVVRIRRMLSRLEGKTFRPTGEVVVQAVEEHPAAGPPARRRATLPAAPAAAVGGTVAGDIDEGLRTLAYLPEVVRREVLAVVASPSYSHGCLWQLYSGDLPYRHDLAVLRIDESSAVVVVAVQEAATVPSGVPASAAQAHVAAQPWEVTRYSYRLHDKVVRGELVS